MQLLCYTLEEGENIARFVLANRSVLAILQLGCVCPVMVAGSYEQRKIHLMQHWNLQTSTVVYPHSD
jgi:porphobilinogen deaminase